MDDCNSEVSDLDQEALDMTIQIMQIWGWSKERIEHHQHLQVQRISGSTHRYDVDNFKIPNHVRRAA